MRKINIKQIEKITKISIALCCLSVISIVFIDTHEDPYYINTIRGMTLFGFGISLPLYLLVRSYNHIIDLISSK